MKKLISVLLCLLLCCAPASFAEASASPSSGFNVDVMTAVCELLDSHNVYSFFIDNAALLSSLIGQDISPLEDDYQWLSYARTFAFPLSDDSGIAVTLSHRNNIVDSVSFVYQCASASEATDAAFLIFNDLLLTDDNDTFFYVDPDCSQQVDYATVCAALVEEPPKNASAVRIGSDWLLFADYTPDTPEYFIVVLTK